MNAREKAKRSLDGPAFVAEGRLRDGIAIGRALGGSSRRIGWALLDLADAVREHTKAVTREPTVGIRNESCTCGGIAGADEDCPFHYMQPAPAAQAPQAEGYRELYLALRQLEDDPVAFKEAARGIIFVQSQKGA